MSISTTIVDSGLWGYGVGTAPIYFPPGKHYLDDTFLIQSRAGAVIEGAGQYLTQLTWRGTNPDKFAIMSHANRGLTIRNLSINFETPAKGAIGFGTRGHGVGNCISTSCKVENVTIDGARSRLQYGIAIDSRLDGGTDNNNEHHVIKGCKIQGCAIAGIGVYSSQSHRCVFEDNGLIDCKTAFDLPHCSQTVRGNFGYANDLILYAAQTFGGAMLFEYNNFEDCKRFCQLMTASRVERYSITNNRCDNMPLAWPVVFRDFNNTYPVWLSGSCDFRGNYLSQKDQTKPIVVGFNGTAKRMVFSSNWIGTKTPPRFDFAWGAAVADLGEWKGNHYWIDGQRDVDLPPVPCAPF